MTPDDAYLDTLATYVIGASKASNQQRLALKLLDPFQLPPSRLKRVTLKKGDCSILDIVFQCTRTFDSIFFDSSRACETESSAKVCTRPILQVTVERQRKKDAEFAAAIVAARVFVRLTLQHPELYPDRYERLTQWLDGVQPLSLDHATISDAMKNGHGAHLEPVWSSIKFVRIDNDDALLPSMRISNIDDPTIKIIECTEETLNNTSPTKSATSKAGSPVKETPPETVPASGDTAAAHSADPNAIGDDETLIQRTCWLPKHFSESLSKVWDVQPDGTMLVHFHVFSIAMFDAHSPAYDPTILPAHVHVAPCSNFVLLSASRLPVDQIPTISIFPFHKGGTEPRPCQIEWKYVGSAKLDVDQVKLLAAFQAELFDPLERVLPAARRWVIESGTIRPKKNADHHHHESMEPSNADTQAEAATEMVVDSRLGYPRPGLLSSKMPSSTAAEPMCSDEKPQVPAASRLKITSKPCVDDLFDFLTNRTAAPVSFFEHPDTSVQIESDIPEEGNSTRPGLVSSSFNYPHHGFFKRYIVAPSTLTAEALNRVNQLPPKRFPMVSDTIYAENDLASNDPLLSLIDWTVIKQTLAFDLCPIVDMFPDLFNTQNADVDAKFPQTEKEKISDGDAADMMQVEPHEDPSPRLELMKQAVIASIAQQQQQWNELNAVLKNRVLVSMYNGLACSFDSIQFDRSPLSTFDDKCNLSLEEIFRERHYIQIKYQQPLLDTSICHLRTRHAFLLPKAIHERRSVSVIPEVCGVVSMPLDLFLSTQYLPSILWRLEASLSVFDFLITSQHLMRSEMDPSSESPVHEAYLSKLVETNFPGCALVSLSSPIQPLQCRTFISSLTGSGASHLKNSNYERLEHLGDCFLKYAIGVSLFLQYPHLRESHMSTLRMVYTSNTTLAILSFLADLPFHGINECFQTGRWLRPGWPHLSLVQNQEVGRSSTRDVVKRIQASMAVAQGKADDQTASTADAMASECDLEAQAPLCVEQKFGMKQIADLLESTIGAVLVTYGIDAALSYMNQVRVPEGVMPLYNSILKLGTREQADTRHPKALPLALYDMTVHLHKQILPHRTLLENVEKQPIVLNRIKWLQQWQSMLAEFQKSPMPLQTLDPNQIQQIESILKYHFQCPELLALALTKNLVYHPSGISFERLEYLGDCVFDCLITCWLMSEYPNMGPGALTIRRQSFVCNNSIGRILHRSGIMNIFLSRSEPVNNSSAFPLAYGSIFESLIGSVYVDSKLDLDVVWRVFAPLLAHL